MAGFVIRYSLLTTMLDDDTVRREQDCVLIISISQCGMSNYNINRSFSICDFIVMPRSADMLEGASTERKWN